VLRRSREVEPSRGAGRAARAGTPDGTTSTAATALERETNDDFVLSVREPFDKGAGVGAGPLLAHWHVPLFDRPAALQQQQVDPIRPQQLLGGAASAARFPESEPRARDPPLQCGHAAAGGAFARAVWTLAAGVSWSEQWHAMSGNESTGTSTAASQARTSAVIVLQNRIEGPRGLQ